MNEYDIDKGSGFHDEHGFAPGSCDGAGRSNGDGVGGGFESGDSMPHKNGYGANVGCYASTSGAGYGKGLADGCGHIEG